MTSHETRQSFFNQMLNERERQDVLHPGTSDIPDGAETFNAVGRGTYEQIAKNSCDRAHRENRLTYSHVLEEESAEVLTAAAKGDIDKLEEELVQCAAVCLKWYEAIQRRKKT